RPGSGLPLVPYATLLRSVAVGGWARWWAEVLDRPRRLGVQGVLSELVLAGVGGGGEGAQVVSHRPGMVGSHRGPAGGGGVAFGALGRAHDASPVTGAGGV